MDSLRPSPLPSPDRGFSRLLKTNSRKAGDPTESSAASLAPSDAGSEPNALRKSFDRGLDRLKERRRDSTDKGDGESSHSSGRKSGLGKLVSSRSRRRKNKRDPKGDDSDSSMLGVPGRHRSSKLHLNAANVSTDSLGNPRSAASSLMLTDDSDPDLTATRPDLVSRASHKGFLTFSSPLIAAEAIQTSPPAASDASAALPQASTNPGSDPSTVTSSKPPTIERPSSANSSKPSIKVTTFPPDLDSELPAVTPPAPAARARGHIPKSSSGSTLPIPGIGAKPPSAVPQDTLAHRRVRSATSASKKGTFTSALTPTVEEAKTPGGSIITPSGSSGFFSGFFSAAQNAASQFSNSFTNTPGLNRTRSATQSSDLKVNPIAASPETKHPSETTSETSVQVEPAIATLGAGNLSLTHLGITDHRSDTDPMATHTETALGDTVRLGHNPSASREEASAADAVSAAYNGAEGGDRPVPVVTDPVPGRPRSLASNFGGDQTPPRSLINNLEPDGGSIIRAGSVRSRLSGHRRKHRNSSTAGAGAIAAAVAASHGAIANPASRRPTGFQVANSRRNKEFHQFFKSVPEDDHLVEDYSAALQRDILLQGRFYISERHICFSSNILGWVTNLVIGFDEVLSMEKKSTAMIFPNAIVIQTLHAKNVFASFISRDPTYDLLIRIWKIGHPNIKTTETGHALDESGSGDRGENGDGAESDDEDDDGSTDEDDDAEDMQDAASSIGRPASLANEVVEGQRQVSKATVAGSGTAAAGSPSKVADGTQTSIPAGGQDFPGPAQHAPTECSDQDSHYEKLCLDGIIPAPLGKVYSLMFGPQSGVAMRKFLIEDEKSSDLQLEDDKKGMDNDAKSMSYSYVKPLSAPVGPRQTKVLVTQTLDAFDLDKAVSVTCSTQTPDVPSGNIFTVKTRYCLMWAAGNQTKIHMSSVVEWSGKSWLKGPIEKGAGDGQAQYGKSLAAFLKTQVAARAALGKPVKVKGKGKRKRVATDASLDDAVSAKPAKEQKGSNWGPLEPVHALLEPITGILEPLMSPVAVLSVLLLLVSVMWLRSGGKATAADSLAMPSLAAYQRAAAYDQLWKREESQLWDWLETRLELDGIETASGKAGLKRDVPHAKAGMAEKLHEKRMTERQVDEAIRTTEERLQELKLIVDRQRNHANAS